MENLKIEQIERINNVYESICEMDSQKESLQDKIENLFQYYDCAGFSLKNENDLFKLLAI